MLGTGGLNVAVLIDMPMPLNCAGCRLTADGWCYAVGIHEQPGHINTNTRPSWCPLVEVHIPTHNADMDKLMQEAGWE